MLGEFERALNAKSKQVNIFPGVTEKSFAVIANSGLKYVVYVRENLGQTSFQVIIFGGSAAGHLVSSISKEMSKSGFPGTRVIIDNDGDMIIESEVYCATEESLIEMDEAFEAAISFMTHQELGIIPVKW